MMTTKEYFTNEEKEEKSSKTLNNGTPTISAKQMKNFLFQTTQVPNYCDQGDTSRWMRSKKFLLQKLQGIIPQNAVQRDDYPVKKTLNKSSFIVLVSPSFLSNGLVSTKCADQNSYRLSFQRTFRQLHRTNLLYDEDDTHIGVSIQNTRNGLDFKYDSPAMSKNIENQNIQTNKNKLVNEQNNMTNDVNSMKLRMPALKLTKNSKQIFKHFRSISFTMYLLFILLLYNSESNSYQSFKEQKMICLLYGLIAPISFSNGLFVSASNSYGSGGFSDRDDIYGSQNRDLNVRHKSLDTYTSSRDFQAGSNFEYENRLSDTKKYSTNANLDNQSRGQKNYLSSFSSSSYDPNRAPNFLQRTFSEIQLKRTFRSAGCVNDEIKLVCSRSTDPDAVLIIENATFYSIDDSSLNCSTGPFGPVPITKQHHKFPPLFHKSIYNPTAFQLSNHKSNNEELSQTTTDTLPEWMTSTLIPSSQSIMKKSNKWQPVTQRTIMAQDVIEVSRDLRQALNRRCSGLANGRICSFNLHLDHEQSQLWGSGMVDIFYRCIPKRKIEATCSPLQTSSSNSYSSYSRSSSYKKSRGGNVGTRRQENDEKANFNNNKRVVSTTPSNPSGFLMSPAYPKYYKGGRKCKWSLKVDPGQRIQVRLLDVNLRDEMRTSRERGRGERRECSTDSIRVSEKGKNLLRMCGEMKNDILLLSHGNQLEVRLDTKNQGTVSRRGILIEYWPVGCPAQHEPGYGHTSFRNDTHATFTCSLGHVFTSNFERSKTVSCGVDNRWSDSATSCVSLDFLKQYGNATVQAIIASKISLYSSSRGSYSSSQSSSGGLQHSGIIGWSHSDEVVPPLSSAWLSDVVLPTIIVGIIVIISLFAVIVLIMLRRHIHLEGNGRHEYSIHHGPYLGHASGSVMGCSNGLGPGIANLEEVLTDNDSDSCNALTPASLQRQQQHYQSTFSNPVSSSSYNNVLLNNTNSSGHVRFNQTNSSLSSSSPVLQHLMQPYNPSPAATTTSIESIETTIPSTQTLLPTVTSSTASPNNIQSTFLPKQTKVEQRSISSFIEKQQQQNNNHNINGFSNNGGVTSNHSSNTIGRKKPTSSSSNGNLCESHETKAATAKGHHTLARLGVNNRQREELFLC